MRTTWPTVSAATWLVCCSVAWSDTPAIIVRPTVAQSGPGTIPPYYATSRLEAGQGVVIVSEEGDYFGIRPPPGSFSYLPRQAVRLVSGQKGVGVVEQATPTLVGSQLGPDATTQGTRLSPGTLVRILGESRIQVGEQWLDVFRIEPVGEKRYVAKSAVSVQQTAGHTQKLSSAVSLDTAALPSGTLRQEAERAYQLGCQTGDFTEAKRLYRELSQSSDSQLRCEALNRLEFIRLREREWASHRPNTSTVRPTAYTPTKVAGVPSEGSVSRSEPSVSWTPPTPHKPTPAMMNGSRVHGVLRQSALRERGQPLYFVEDHLGRLRCYVEVPNSFQAQAQALLNRAVEIQGNSVGYRGDLRSELITVMSIRPLE